MREYNQCTFLLVDKIASVSPLTFKSTVCIAECSVTGVPLYLLSTISVNTRMCLIEGQMLCTAYSREPAIFSMSQKIRKEKYISAPLTRFCSAQNVFSGQFQLTLPRYRGTNSASNMKGVLLVLCTYQGDGT